MTENEIIEKKADAAAIITKLGEIRTFLNGLKDQPRWFGGLPPSFTQIDSMAEHHANVVREVFRPDE